MSYFAEERRHFVVTSVAASKSPLMNTKKCVLLER